MKNMVFILRTINVVLLIWVWCGLSANNISISNVLLHGQDESAGVNNSANFRKIRLDIAWENSWRTSTLESNWDAAWVFVKYRNLSYDTWYHATLDATGHTAPVGSEIIPSPDGKGIFIQRSANGIGNIDWDDIDLKWRYVLDGLNDYDSVQICVFAIEMVYIPTGSFYLGDGATTGLRGNFASAATTTPFQLTSEALLTLGGGGAGSLGNNNGVNMPGGTDDFNNTTSRTLPAAYPKGYNPFYCMKYLITQEQYVGFLNKLTRTQQGNRKQGVTVGRYFNDATTPQARNGIKLLSDPGGISPRVYGCDLNGNDIANEDEDGQHIACNIFNKGDLLAYLDWSGLRPITELEYEKACRGHNLYPVAGEYAWGTTNITAAIGLTNGGRYDEIASNVGANCNYGNLIVGPVRVGAFAKGATSRQAAGATYYGIMEMCNNLWQLYTNVNASGRVFTGLHGTGQLDVNGNATVANWSALGLGLRGGQYGHTDPEYGEVSIRGYSTWNDNNRQYFLGGRGGRTAP